MSTVLVSGGGRGIGRAVALRFAAEGWSVAVLSRTAEQVNDTVAAIESAGAKGLAVVSDINATTAGAEAVAACVEQLGSLDVLVNNAGVFRTAPLLDTDDDLWEQVVGTNLTAAFRLTRAAVGAMVERGQGGCIVNVSSVAGKQGFPGSAAYCASKFGLLGLGDAVREEVRGHGIRVLNVCPGQVDTAAWDTCGLDLAAIGIDRNKMMSADDVAAAIAGAVLHGGSAVAEEMLLKPPSGD